MGALQFHRPTFSVVGTDENLTRRDCKIVLGVFSLITGKTLSEFF